MVTDVLGQAVRNYQQLCAKIWVLRAMCFEQFGHEQKNGMDPLLWFMFVFLQETVPFNSCFSKVHLSTGR